MSVLKSFHASYFSPATPVNSLLIYTVDTVVGQATIVLSIMRTNKVRSISGGYHVQLTTTSRSRIFLTAQRKLLTAWVFVGLAPFILQLRSFLQFATPHKITETLVPPPDAVSETANLSDVCPMNGVQIGKIWWNIDCTHYYSVTYGHICHFVVPQYNTHGQFLIGHSKTAPISMVPASCREDSYPFSLYFYHGSIGYFSYYEEMEGTYCAKDNTSYAIVGGLGTFDMNGSRLADDFGSADYRQSYCYSVTGAIWLMYRALVLRRSFISCKRYGRRCDRMGDHLQRRPVMVFVHESLRLSAHGATNYHRFVLLYFLAEGIMCDLFLLVANDGVFAWIQYISLGYNLSGILLVLFEMVEKIGVLPETWRLLIKRLLFNYEAALLGELLSAAGQHKLMTSLNRSDLKTTRPTALAVSYYMWSLVGHGVFLLCLIAFIMAVRATWAIGYVWFRHGTLAVFSAPCCVDSTVGMRNKMTMLGGYHWEGGRLYYKMEGLKSFGLLKMIEEDGSEFLVLRKLNWLVVPINELFVIGVVSNQYVESCAERPCTGVVSFFDRGLGDAGFNPSRSRRLLSIFPRNKVSTSTPR